jgi:hypothetical protein
MVMLWGGRGIFSHILQSALLNPGIDDLAMLYAAVNVNSVPPLVRGRREFDVES